MDKSYIYVLKDPITGEIMYVGKSINPQKRLNQHIYHSKKRKTYVNIWVNNLIEGDYTPIMEVVDECNDNWTEVEKHWIISLYNTNKKLCNLTYIGDKVDRNPNYSIHINDKVLKVKKLIEEISFLKKGKKIKHDDLFYLYDKKEMGQYRKSRKKSLYKELLSIKKYDKILKQDISELTPEMKFIRHLLLNYSKKHSKKKYPEYFQYRKDIINYIKNNGDSLYYNDYTNDEFKEMLITIFKKFVT